MLREHYQLFKRAHLAADLSLTAAGFIACRLVVEPAVPHHRAVDLLFTPAVLIPLAMLAVTLGADDRTYAYRLHRPAVVAGSVVRAWLIAYALALAAFFVFPHWAPNRFLFVLSALVGLLLLVLHHYAVWLALNVYRRSGRSYKNVLIVGTGAVARSVADEIFASPGQGLHVLGFVDWETGRRLWRYRDIPVLGTLADLPAIGKSRQVDMVVFAVGCKTLGRIVEAVHQCGRMGLPTIVLTDIPGPTAARRTAGEFFGRPGVRFDAVPRAHWAMALKGILDRALAAPALIMLAPLFAVAALAIKLSSPGPVFYRQTRIGLNGRPFTLWKFRTMATDADRHKHELASFNEMSGPVFKMSADPRVTRLGRLLRRTSVDELPQLFNVLRGEMSLVGPRPPLPDEVVQYDGWERRRLSVKPGLTCLWQINGRNRIDFQEWMKLDLEYIDTWSLQKDAEILVKTIPAVLRGTGAR